MKAARRPFAPPFLLAGRLLIGQTANILLFLGARHRLSPADEADLRRSVDVSGLGYAFPRAMERAARAHKRLFSLRDRVRERPRIAAYLASQRRIPFNEQGIFRYYPELDAT